MKIYKFVNSGVFVSVVLLFCGIVVCRFMVGSYSKSECNAEEIVDYNIESNIAESSRLYTSEELALVYNTRYAMLDMSRVILGKEEIRLVTMDEDDYEPLYLEYKGKHIFMDNDMTNVLSQGLWSEMGNYDIIDREIARKLRVNEIKSYPIVTSLYEDPVTILMYNREYFKISGTVSGWFKVFPTQPANHQGIEKLLKGFMMNNIGTEYFSTSGGDSYCIVYGDTYVNEVKWTIKVLLHEDNVVKDVLFIPEGGISLANPALNYDDWNVQQLARVDYTDGSESGNISYLYSGSKYKFDGSDEIEFLEEEISMSGINLWSLNNSKGKTIKLVGEYSIGYMEDEESGDIVCYDILDKNIEWCGLHIGGEYTPYELRSVVINGNYNSIRLTETGKYINYAALYQGKWVGDDNGDWAAIICTKDNIVVGITLCRLDKLKLLEF